MYNTKKIDQIDTNQNYSDEIIISLHKIWTDNQGTVHAENSCSPPHPNRTAIVRLVTLYASLQTIDVLCSEANDRRKPNLHLVYITRELVSFLVNLRVYTYPVTPGDRDLSHLESNMEFYP